MRFPIRSFPVALLALVLAVPSMAVTAPRDAPSGGVVLRADVAPGTILDPGDRISFACQTASDAAVIVFNIDTQGYVHLLYPEDQLRTDRAREAIEIPGGGSELVVEGEPGVEFAFALAVDDLAAVDEAALESLRAPAGVPRRIEGDPFIAANMIAAELVRDVSQRAVFFGYTWFYVTERADYPCYLCGECDGSATGSSCDGYRIAQNFDRRAAMSYPLRRGYEMTEVAATSAEESAPPSVALPEDDDDVIVNFYPYGSEVRYADPFAVNLWYDWDWYDPYWYYPYPYYPPYWGWPGWSISIGWGWGWGGYYCSGWYDPWYGWGGYYPYSCYPYYSCYDGGSYATSYPAKYKSQYKSDPGAASTLTANRGYAAKHDGDLRVASRAVKPASARSVSSHGKYTGTGVRTTYNGARVKTSVSGSRTSLSREFSRWRSNSATRGVSGGRSSSSSYRSKAGSAPSGGRSVIQRGVGRSKGSGVSAPRSTTRPGSTGRTSTPRMKGSGSRNAPSAPSSRGSSRGSSGGARSAPRGKGR